jgi:hypothetical protein
MALLALYVTAYICFSVSFSFSYFACIMAIEQYPLAGRWRWDCSSEGHYIGVDMGVTCIFPFKLYDGLAGPFSCTQ